MLGIKCSSIQKVVLAFSLLIACKEQIRVSAAPLGCPVNHDEPVLVPEGTTGIELNIHTEGLCTLTRVTTLDGQKPFLTSVARSYSGYQWEGQNPLNLKFSCDNSSKICSTTLPTIDSQTEEYYLTSFEHSLTDKQATARLLLKTTFGPTKESIANYDFASPAEFVKDQIKIPMLQHRAFYRNNTQAETHHAYEVGQPHHPCEPNSRWRTRAMTGEDIKEFLEASAEGPPYVLSVNGIPRTQVNELVRISPGSKIKMKWGPGVHVPGNRISWTSTEDYIFTNGSSILLKLDPSKTESIGNDDSELIHTSAIDDKVQCSEIPLSGKTDVFAYVDGTWYIHDPILSLRDNTPSKMDEDGGATSTPTAPGVYCPSAPRTSFNEKQCVLSKDPNSCKSIVCPGTSGEVANNPFSPLSLDMVRDPGLDSTNGPLHDFEYQKWTIWIHAALHSPDQLRQRVAWAFYQILVLATNLHDTWTEHHLTFYDIFVRNAFGNFRDVLKEVSFSPMMAMSLSFLWSNSRTYVWERTGKYVYPDENYAREIMQLFTIGLFKLNKDGTNVLDQNGDRIPTYDSDDIMEMARAWTGFRPQDKRGNIENARSKASGNRIDYLKIDGRVRDPFPKMDLNGGYIGDGLPLCVDNPDKPFLRSGATYRLLGPSDQPELFTRHSRWMSAGEAKVVELDTADALYGILCNAPSTESECNFQTEVTLTSTISLTSKPTMIESVDTVRVVKVNANTYYEYVPNPCVYLPFYNDGKKIKSGPDGVSSMCTHPSSLAADGCCRPGERYAFSSCKFSAEAIKFDTHAQRCQAMGGRVPCDINRYRPDRSTCSKYFRWHWTDKGCSIEAKVDDEGKVSIVHAPESATDSDVHKRYSIKSPTFFRVKWTNGTFPSPANGCGDGMCTLYGQTCRCQTAEMSVPVIEDNVFNAHLSSSPASDDVNNMVAKLHIGAVDPTNDDAYKMSHIWSVEKYDVQIWKSAEDEIIEVAEKRTSRTTFFQNRISVVKIVKSDAGESDYEFRNPPMFGSDHRDAIYETEKVLDHFFYHENTAPFMSIRLIQRFGVSNPTPGYVERVASAFESGLYMQSGVTFGSGKYGDLESTIAAVVLDRESISAVLDADPSSGSLREPLLKTMHFLKSMDYRPKGDFAIFYKMDQQIGQMAHGQESVFSFFLPDYTPPGVISSAGLVAPEALLMNTPYVMGLMKGLFSLVKWGSTTCDGGFGTGRSSNCYRYTEGDYSGTNGQLKYLPSSYDSTEMISELDLLLTGGRLNKKSHALIESALEDAEVTDDAQKLRLLLQLMVGTPEFHTTNNLIKIDSEEARAAPEPKEVPSHPYKAIVYVMLNGGADSFNMLVPHSECTGNDMYEEYKAIRGSIALEKEQLLPIKAGINQPCSVFGLHPKLNTMQKLYNSGDVAFFANTGLLHKNSTRGNYRANHKSTALFGHGIRRAIQIVNFKSDIYNTGILGRITDVLTSKGYKTGKTTTGSKGAAGPDSLASEPLKSPPISHVSSNAGMAPFNPAPSISNMHDVLKGLNNATQLSSSMFGESWSDQFLQSMHDNDAFFETMFTTNVETAFLGSDLGNKLELVSRLIKAHKQRGIDRDVFYVSFGRFDSHSDTAETINRYFAEMDSAINSFSKEMKIQSLWDSVVVVTVSDFGRSLTPNAGDGTDHAWGGNYLIAGGSVAGTQIHGSYPDSFDSTNPLMLGRGRLIPTTGWDSVWNGISEWFGVEESELDRVLPSRKNFDNLLTKDQMFTPTTTAIITTPEVAPSPSETPVGDVPVTSVAGTPYTKTVDFSNLRGKIDGHFKIGGASFGDKRVQVGKTKEGEDVVYSISISDYDFDGGGQPNDSLSFKVRMRAFDDVNVYMCKGFCAAASGGTQTKSQAHQKYFGVKKDSRIRARQSLTFSVEDVSLTADPGFTAEFDGFTKAYVTGGSYIIGEGVKVEGRVVGTGYMGFDPISELRLTTPDSTQRIWDLMGRFTVSGYTLDSMSPSAYPSALPSAHPTMLPSAYPTALPSAYPTTLPSAYPTTLPPTRAPAAGTLYERNVQFINLRGTPSKVFRINGVSLRSSRVSVTKVTENEDTNNQEIVYSVKLQGYDLDGGGKKNDSLSFKVRFRALNKVTNQGCKAPCTTATAIGGSPTIAYGKGNDFGATDGNLHKGESLIFTIEEITLVADEGFQAEFIGFRSVWTLKGDFALGSGNGNAKGVSQKSRSGRIWFKPVQELQLTLTSKRVRVRDLVGLFRVYGYR